MHNIEEIIGVFLLSMVKFGFGGVPLAVLVAKFTFFKSMTITSAGGVTSSILFANISEWALKRTRKFREKHFPHHAYKPHPLLHSKLAIAISNKWGLVGLAIFTPFILSIPIGTLLAVYFYHDKHKVVSYMLISIVAWGALFCWFYNSMSPHLANIFHHL